MSLDKFLLAKSISAEKILEIEYINAVAPRKDEEPSLHDDWVSSINGSDPRFIVTGCYDSLARVWKAAGECTHILKGHSDVIASVGVINQKVSASFQLSRFSVAASLHCQFLSCSIYTSVEGITVATASKDRTLRLWKFDREDSINNPIRIRAFKILRGHTKSVQCDAAQNTGNMVCSGSWDSTIKLWQTNDSQSDGDLVSIKKRKGNDQADESQLEGEAVSTLVGDTQCVSCGMATAGNNIFCIMGSFC